MDAADNGDREQKAEDLVEEEWQEGKRREEQAEIIVSDDPQALGIVEGFRIDSLSMRDGDTGELFWQEDEWADDLFDDELEAHLPVEILERDSVSREIVFTSRSEIKALRLSQKLILNGVAIEQWHFHFGFVIPGSTNSWTQTIAGADHRIEASVLSGNLLIETSFYDGNLFLCKCVVRIFYDL
uniref:GMP phosphodiesterase delta subunit domain-containing protein n=1 Tax=Pinguiococcus pyrenoidosus TaxID=172671 RepID=A0A7R9YGP7_9STRA|mmetsp:Transcript_9414/g.35252  ORF Transcript_9414/g.35252 Transcript_9414/m.35252 type:complete len:184 (+) Transcript_9414:148-699(+)